MTEGLLVLHVFVGLLFAAHGAQKLFGWFNGPGIEGGTGFMGSLGLEPARFNALAAGLIEFVGGILFMLGLLNPLGSLGIIASMIVAIVKVHGLRLWAGENGMELPLTNAIVAFAVALSGPGVYSLDQLLGVALPEPYTLFIGLLFVTLAASLAVLPLNGLTTGTLNWQTFAHLAFAFRVTPTLLVWGMVFALVMGALGGLPPAIRGARSSVPSSTSIWVAPGSSVSGIRKTPLSKVLVKRHIPEPSKKRIRKAFFLRLKKTKSAPQRAS